MSYILEALKKAESERERGQVPSLHTAPLNHSMRLTNGNAAAPWLRWLFALAVLLALAWAYATWRSQAAVSPATSVDGSPAALAVAVAAKASAPASAAAIAAVPVVTDSVTRSRVVPVVAPAAPLGTAIAAPPAAPPAAAPLAAPAKAAPAEAIPAKAAVAAGPALPEPLPKPVATASRSNTGALPLLQELPESLRRQMPALNISGAVYSDAPPEWTLIINDQVIGKGGQIAPDLRLEEVGPNNAVFSFRGQRFRMDR